MGVFSGLKTFAAGTGKGIAKGGFGGFLLGAAVSVGVAALISFGGLAVLGAALGALGSHFTALSILSGFSASSVLSFGGIAAGIAGTLGLSVVTSPISMPAILPWTMGAGAAVGGIFGGAKEVGEDAKRQGASKDRLEQAWQRVHNNDEIINHQLQQLHEDAQGRQNMSQEQLVAENNALRQQMMQMMQQMGNYGHKGRGGQRGHQGQQRQGGGSPLNADYYRNQQGQQGQYVHGHA